MQQIYILGDLHGDVGAIMRFLMINDVTNASIIQVGDFGIGFQTKKREHTILQLLNNVLAARKVKLYIIRGNHDNPDCFKDGSNNKSNISFLPDYSVIKLAGKHFLCIGGALSIDRSNREADKNYWYKEEFIFKQERLTNLRNIDIVITHSAPDIVYPFDMSGINFEYFRRDPTLRPALVQERLNLTKTYNILKQKPKNKVTHWFYGHFHEHHEMQYEETKFILLGLNEFYKLE